jgi:hypothetical protein
MLIGLVKLELKKNNNCKKKSTKKRMKLINSELFYDQ